VSRWARQAEISRAHSKNAAQRADCRLLALHTQPRSLSPATGRAKGRNEEADASSLVGTRLMDDERAQTRAREGVPRGRRGPGRRLKGLQPTINKRQGRRYRRKRCLRDAAASLLFLSLSLSLSPPRIFIARALSLRQLPETANNPPPDKHSHRGRISRRRYFVRNKKKRRRAVRKGIIFCKPGGRRRRGASATLQIDVRLRCDFPR